MEADGSLGVFLTEKGYPAVHVFHIVDAPVIGAAAALPMAPDIWHQYIVPFFQIDLGIGDTHGPVLVQSMEQDDGIVAS